MSNHESINSHTLAEQLRAKHWTGTYKTMGNGRVFYYDIHDKHICTVTYNNAISKIIKVEWL